MEKFLYIEYIERTGHLRILSRKYFPIASLNKENSGDHHDMHFMALALEGKVAKIDKEKAISTCGRGHYVML